MSNPNIPRAYGQTSICLIGAALNATVDIYIVPAGVVFYLTGGFLVATVMAASVLGNAFLNNNPGRPLLHILARTSALIDTQVSCLPLCLSVALPFPAGTVFQVISDNANVYATGGITGWEEPI